MKNANTIKTVKTSAETKALAMDPISVAKRKLDEARADYKRIKEINEGPKVTKVVDPKRDEIRKKLVEVKQKRLLAVNEIKAAKAVIEAKRKEISALSEEKKALRLSIKKTPRAVSPKSKAIKEAQVALLEAELAYRKACLG